MKRRKLPIGIQTFREIRADNHYYVEPLAKFLTSEHLSLSCPAKVVNFQPFC